MYHPLFIQPFLNDRRHDVVRTADDGRIATRSRSRRRRRRAPSRP